MVEEVSIFVNRFMKHFNSPSCLFMKHNPVV